MKRWTPTMHAEAHAWVRASLARLSVCDLGGYDVNGTVRDLFPGWTYTSVDRRAGPGVDVVADAADFGGGPFDLVVCCEAMEHASNWRAIVGNAFRILRPGGLFVTTAAGPARAPHTSDGDPWSATSGGEHYANIDPADLAAVLAAAGFAGIVVDVTPDSADVRAVGRRP